jgi:hypothetical protein
VRMLTRLGLKTHGNPMINNGQALKQAANVRAKVLAPIIRALKGKGLVSFSAIARELNKREIPTARRGRWHPSSVSRLLQRLKKLQHPSNSRHRR